MPGRMPRSLRRAPPSGDLDIKGICSDGVLRHASRSAMSYTDEQIFDALASFFVKEGISREGAIAVAPDTDIIAQGLVDSLGIFKLIAFVEENFAVTIEPDEVLLENFQTLRALRNLIVKKLTSAAQNLDAV
ncbi:MAG: acyl carrier protein [Betaproteobacteria bacterium]|nr:MAG: acyl carrier protein [Betaproteobacteria bacterium]